MSDLSTICTVIVSFSLGFLVKCIFDLFFVVNVRDNAQNTFWQEAQKSEQKQNLEKGKEKDLEGEENLQKRSVEEKLEESSPEFNSNNIVDIKNTHILVQKTNHENSSCKKEDIMEDECFELEENPKELDLSSIILANVHKKIESENVEEKCFEEEEEKMMEFEEREEIPFFDECKTNYENQIEEKEQSKEEEEEENLELWNDVSNLVRERNTSFELSKKQLSKFNEYCLSPVKNDESGVLTSTSSSSENEEEQIMTNRSCDSTDLNNLISSPNDSSISLKSIPNEELSVKPMMEDISSLIFANVDAHNKNLEKKISKEIYSEKEREPTKIINLSEVSLEDEDISSIVLGKTIKAKNGQKKITEETESPRIIKLVDGKIQESDSNIMKNCVDSVLDENCEFFTDANNVVDLENLSTSFNLGKFLQRTPSEGWSDDSFRGDMASSSGLTPEDFTTSSCCTQIPPTQHNLQLQASPELNSAKPPVSLMARLSNNKQKLNAIPKREKTEKQRKTLKLNIEKLDESQVLSSSFWQPIIGNELDRTLDFKPDELSYRFSFKKKINFDGFWNDPNTSDPPFKVEQRIVDYGNGKMECILFDFSLNEWVCDRTNSVTERKPTDRIVWHTDNTEDKRVMLWERYTVLNAAEDVLLEDFRIRLPPLCSHLIGKFAGEKTWIPSRPRKKAFRESLFGEARCIQVRKVLKKMGLWNKLSTKNVEKIADQILKFNEAGLDLESIADLNNIIPDENEICMLASRTLSDLETMTDKCLKIFSEIPLINERLYTWLFIKHFDETVQNLNSLMEILDSTHKAIYHNKSLKLMFGLVLSVCNYMNEGNEFGSAYGFKLDSLQQLKARRANQQSLLFYIVLIAYHKHPGALRFVHELSILSNGSLTCENMVGLRSRVDSLHFETSRLREIANSPETDKYFVAKLNTFLEIAQPSVSALEDRMSRISSNFIALGRAFGEEESDLNVLFFYYIETLNKFRIDVQEVVTKITETKEAQERKLQTKRQWNKRRQRKGSGFSDSDYTSEEDAIQQAEFIAVKKRLDKKRNNRVENQKLSLCKRLFGDGDASADIPSYEKLLLSFEEHRQDRQEQLLDKF